MTSFVSIYRSLVNYKACLNLPVLQEIFFCSLGMVPLKSSLKLFAFIANAIKAKKFPNHYSSLSSVKLFVTHGGLLSTVDIIKRGKPSVCAPHIADQFYNCRKMNSWGSSETASSFKFSVINDAVSKILDSYSLYMNNAAKYKDDFSQYENADALSAFLEKIAARKRTSIVIDFAFQLNSDNAIRFWIALKIGLYLIAVGLPSLILLCCCRRKKSEASKHLPKSKTHWPVSNINSGYEIIECRLTGGK